MERRPKLLYDGDLGVEHLAREALLRDSVAQHPAGLIALIEHRDLVTTLQQVVRGGESGRASPDDRHALAR